MAGSWFLYCESKSAELPPSPPYCTFNEDGKRWQLRCKLVMGETVGWPARVMGGSMQGRDVRLSSEIKNFCISTVFSLNEKMGSVMGAKPKD